MSEQSSNSKQLHKELKEAKDAAIGRRDMLKIAGMTAVVTGIAFLGLSMTGKSVYADDPCCSECDATYTVISVL